MQMRKSLIVGAILAGFTGTALAETSVTLYGLIDTGLIYQRAKLGRTDDAGSTSNQSRFALQSGQQSGSRWGLRGVEDLGNGVSANFVLESGFSVNSGRHDNNDRLFGRQATVGLTSALGSIDFGRQTNVASRFLEGVDPFALDFYQANAGSTFAAANTVRYDNTVMYTSPYLAGFQFAGGYSFSIDDTAPGQPRFKTGGNSRAVTAGGRYVSGPLQVALTYDQQYLKPNQPRPKQAILGAAFDFEVVKLGAAYGYSKDGQISGPDLPLAEGRSDNAFGGTNGSFTWSGLKVHSYMLGASAPIGATSSLFGSVQRADPNQNLAPTNIYSLGTTHNLSKRTNLYAYGSYAENFAFIKGNKATTVGAGVRHQF